MIYFQSQSNKNKSFSSRAGFTLVETLVAIAILSLSILGTFTAVQKGLQSSAFAQDQVTAFYLAQESMEYIRNIRDENALASIVSTSAGGPAVDWLTGMSSSAGDPCYFGKTCMIDSPNKTMTACNGGLGSCPFLNQDTTTGLFGYTGSWAQSKFRREIQFQQVNNREIVVMVSISWNSASMAKTLQVRETLLNIH